MIKFNSLPYQILLSTAFIVLGFSNIQAQIMAPKAQSEFWQKVQFGGGLGLNFGSKYTNISIAPGAIYNVNEYFAIGLGAQYSYINQKPFTFNSSQVVEYTSNLYGGSVVALFNPIQSIQLSAEVEQLRVNTERKVITNAIVQNVNDDFWNTALFLGAGFRTGNVTIGARYNLLFDKNKNVYSEPFMPFVRVYF